MMISIHAPVKGATKRYGFGKLVHDDFNPRSREGSDPLHGSIRALAVYFNPRSREGSDRLT